MSSLPISNTPDITFEQVMHSLSLESVTTETASALYAKIDAAGAEMAKDALERYQSDQQRIRRVRQELSARIRHRLRASRGFYRVPAEIWMMIFKLVCPAPFIPDESQSDSLSSTDPRLVISRVCSLWREILETLPEMWTSISLRDWDVLDRAQQDLPSFLTNRFDTLSDILRLSDRLPLHIKLSAPPSLSFITPLLHHAVHILAKHSDRWATLDVLDSNDQPVGQAIESCATLVGIDAFPLLESLSYGWDGEEEDDSERDDPDSADYFPGSSQEMPKLRSLKLNTLSPSINSVQWPLLTTVTLQNIRMEFRRRVLPHLLSVVYLEIQWDIDLDEPNDTPADGVSDFVLPKLQRLRLYEWETQFYSHMKAPQLGHLTINMMHSDEVPALTRFITRSECSITTFNIEDSYWNLESAEDRDKNAFRNLLFAMPTLQTLQVLYGGCDWNAEDDGISLLLRPLSQQNDGGMLSCCPRLYNLTIDFSGRYTPSSATSFIDMVENRWNASNLAGSDGLRAVGGIPNLDKVRFPGDGALKEVLLQRLEAMRVEGLRSIS